MRCPLKIAILADLIDTEVFKGQQSYAFNLISGLRKNGVFCTLFYADIPKKTRYPEHRKMSYRICGLPLVNQYIKDRLINVKVSDYNILHSLTNCEMPLGRSRAKKILTLHDVMPFKHPEFFSDYTLSYFKRDLQKIIPVVDTIITDSQFSKNDITDVLAYNADKINIIYLGIDNKIFFKKKVPSPIPEKYILYVGGFNRRKGLSFLLEAFAKIKESIVHKLVLVGSTGWENTNIEKLISDSKLKDRVILMSIATSEELANYYSHADLLVYPSLYEGFGLPPLEAMACECPVITSDNTSLREIYKNAAVLVDPKDVDSLAEQILRVISDKELKDKMIWEGILLSRRLTQEKMVENTIRVYEKVLSR